MKLIAEEMGLVFLAKEEARARERQRIGKPLSRLQDLTLKLRSLNPNEAEFFELAAAHLRKRLRPNRTYGIFFLVFGAVPLLLAVFYGAPLWFGAIAYLCFGALGLVLFCHSSASVHKLAARSESEDAGRRLARLRDVAINNRQDPIAALFLERTEGDVR